MGDIIYRMSFCNVCNVIFKRLQKSVNNRNLKHLLGPDAIGIKV